MTPAIWLACLIGLSVPGSSSRAAEAAKPPRPFAAATLLQLDGAVFSVEQSQARGLRDMLARDAQARLRAAAIRENRAWDTVKTAADWEHFRAQRLAALRAALGQFPTPPAEPRVRVTGRLEGDGYRIENLAFESRPGCLVTANLYLPARAAGAMPGILLAHSHHNPKTQGELQDMGMTWARLGCAVLMMDHWGHGERRQHPFVSAAQFPRAFRVGRQDYYFRYTTALQLETIGDSLLGWMVWDLWRGVDLLLARPGIDRNRMLLIGAVAGGGDPAGVAAALDSRITAVAPFNFGGPQPDYAIPGDAENNFYWFGVPGWETTRSLRYGARDGFAHWTIVTAVAPRRLIYSHEFSWDAARDPAWPRLQRVFQLAGVPDHLAVATGRGTLRGSPPESTHCNNLGPVHRAQLYPILQRWFGIPAPDHEYQRRREDKELQCLTPEIVSELRPRPLHELARELGQQRAAAARRRLANLEPAARRQQLLRQWAALLGDIEPRAAAAMVQRRQERIGPITAEWGALETEPGIVVPFLLLRPETRTAGPAPVIVGVAQTGKQGFLQHRSEQIAGWLAEGAAVCLPDVRGTGETAPGGSRDFRSNATTWSQAEWMLGQTRVGTQLRDLRSLLRHLRTRPELDAARVTLWGDSFAPVNSATENLRVPLDLADGVPHAEPLGAHLALLGALYEDTVCRVRLRGGLVSFASMLDEPFCYVPHDATVPGASTAGDLADVIAALAPRLVRVEHPVDAQNRRVPAQRLAEILAPARAAYAAVHAERQLECDPSAPE